MAFVRPLILSVLIMALVAGGLPVSDSLARWSRPSASRGKGKHLRRRHSRAWWRRRRAWLKRKQALAARRRPRPVSEPRPRRDSSASVDKFTNGDASMNSNVSQALVPRSALVAAEASIEAFGDANASKRARRSPAAKSGALAANAKSSRVPFDLTLPGSWTSSAGANAPGEMRFNIRTVDGRAAGTASLAPVRVTGGDAPIGPRTKMLAGVPLTVLRRTVIDRMAAEGGWVVNDVEREIDGRRVYIVFARGSKPGASEQALTFYFTEVEGRIYSLATNTPVELAEPVAPACERIIATFRLSGGAAVASQTLR